MEPKEPSGAERSRAEPSEPSGAERSRAEPSGVSGAEQSCHRAIWRLRFKNAKRSWFMQREISENQQETTTVKVGASTGYPSHRRTWHVICDL